MAWFKNDNLLLKMFDRFLMFAQNIDCHLWIHVRTASFSAFTNNYRRALLESAEVGEKCLTKERALREGRRTRAFEYIAAMKVLA